MMLTRGERNTTFEPRKVKNVAAVLTMSHGQVATLRTAQNICPRIMLLTVNIDSKIMDGRCLLKVSWEKTAQV